MTSRLLTLLVVACLPWLGLSAAARAQGVLRDLDQWVADGGGPFHVGALKGRPSIVTMAYGACRRICSTSLHLMEGLQIQADQRHLDVNFLVLGLDPSQDRPLDWAAFRVEHRLTGGNWFFLSGDAGHVQRLVGQLGVRYWRYGEHTMHDFRIALVSPQGRIMRTLDTFDGEAARLLPDPAAATPGSR